MRRLIYLLLLLILTPHPSAAQETIKEGEVLNIDRCIEIAIIKHPNISAQKGAILASRSRVGEAESNYYPQIGASAGYSRIHSITNNSGAVSTGINGTSSGSFGGSFDQYSGGFTLSQNIYDFGRTSTQVNIQKLNLNSSSSDLETVTEQIIFNVKQAYYGLLQAQRNSIVAAETVKQFQQHLEQAQGFYEVGTKPKFDVTKAEVDLSNSKLSLIKAENAVKVARVTLNNALGVPDAPEYSIEDNLSFQKYPVTFEAAIDQAYKNRPDLQSTVAKRMAAEKTVDRAKRDYLPFLTGNAGYSVGGNRISSLDEGWNVGVAMSFPVFNGFITKNQIEEAKGNLDTARANEDALKQGILLDVQQAYLNLNVAEDSIATTELTVKQATENFDIANGRYAAGVGNPIEVTDAEVLLSNAKTANIQALYDYKIARASLEKAMGIR
jgi:outer membrane protein